jgi:hypothetical protein
MTMRIHLVLFMANFIMVVLFGCGGGGGDDPTNVTPVENGNTNVSGRLFMGGDDVGPWELNFSTGHYSRIPGAQWEDNPNYHHSAVFSAYPSFDGNEYIETISECEYLGDFQYRDCIVFHEKTGEITSTVYVPNETYGPAKLSRDGLYIAVPIKDARNGPLYDEIKLYIYTRDGAYVDMSPHVVNSHGFDWLPGNRLIYSSKKALYITDQTSAKGELWATFNDDEGTPVQLAVSPDGSRLAFTLKSYENTAAIFGTVWVANLDGSRYVQLAMTPGENDPDQSTDDPIINYPTWSPDGNWIAVVDGSIAVYNPPPGLEGSGSTLFIVPSSGENVMLVTNGATDAIPIYSYFDETLTGANNAKYGTKFTSSGGGFAWLK